MGVTYTVQLGLERQAVPCHHVILVCKDMEIMVCCFAFATHSTECPENVDLGCASSDTFPLFLDSHESPKIVAPYVCWASTEAIVALHCVMKYMEGQEAKELATIGPGGRETS